MSCLSKIVTVRDFCNNEQTASLSGYDLMDAPEITVTGLAAMATEKYVSGLTLARETLAKAIKEVSNDFLGVLASNRLGIQLTNTTAFTSTYSTDTINLASAMERGVIWFKSKGIRGKLKKARITEVQVYPLADVESTFINVYDNGKVFKYNVSLVANEINSFNIEHVVEGPSVKVTLDNTDFATASTKLICACDGSMPDGYGEVQGWNGIQTAGREGFGINLKIGYFCDYDQILCDLSKVYVGKVVYLKARLMLLEEHSKSNRFEYWVIKDRKQLDKDIASLNSDYIEQWNLFHAALPDLLANYHDGDCLSCRGIRWVTNI